MSQYNSLKYYEENAQQYFNRVHSWDMTALYTSFLKHVTGKAILDLGCGTGRDARFFAENGYRVLAMDGSREMLAMTQRECPSADCQLVNFNDEFHIDRPLDAVWACASLVHLDDSSFERVLHSVVNSLKASGVIYLGLKQADHGGVPDDGRVFNYWTLEKLLPVTMRCGLTLIAGSIDSTPRITWLNAIFRKNVPAPKG